MRLIDYIVLPHPRANWTAKDHAWLLIAFQLLSTFCLSGCSGCAAKQPPSHRTESQPTADEPTPNNKTPAESSIGNTVQRIPTQKSEPTDDAERAGDEGTNGTRFPSGSTRPPFSTPQTQAQSRKQMGKPTQDADTTLKNVSGLMDKVRQAKGRKDYGDAFRLATQAWEAAHLHPKDSRLQKIAEELTVEMESLGNLANSKFSPKSSYASTKLIDK